MFAARNLDVSHTSSPKKVVTNSFFTAKKLSVSTPNLKKLIQEDEMFEEERQKHLLLQKRLSNKMDPNCSATSALNEKNYLNLSDSLLNPTSNEGIGRDRYQSFKIKENTTGAVQRRPLEERRAQYPVSTAFNDSIVNFQQISVDILIDKPETDKDICEKFNNILGKLIITNYKFLCVDIMQVYTSINLQTFSAAQVCSAKTMRS